MVDSGTASQVSKVLNLASSNPGKLGEFRQAAVGCGWQVEPVPQMDTLPACIEDGKTFEENARKKAVHYARHCPGLVFADDSGLCVSSLGGAPGVYSARFAGPEATEAGNNEKLLNELTGARGGDRAAYYVCIIAGAREGEAVKTFKGRVEGQILEAPRGDGGFGYDSLFLYEPLRMTFAEISAEEKFAVSHRGQAFRKLLDTLASGWGMQLSGQ